jgi:hypothetical protein
MLLNKFIDICLLRKNPQDLPVSHPLMLTAVIAYGITDVIGVLDALTIESALLAATVDTLLLVAVTHLVLHWRALGVRVPQTLSALAGCGALLSFVAWICASLTREWLSPLWVWVPFLVWYTLVFGHVLRHALNIAFAAGVAAGLAYLILSMTMTGLFVTPVSVAD